MAGRYLAGAFQVLSRSAVILNRSRSPISRYLGLFDDGSAHLENSQNIEVKLTIAADNQTSAMLKAGDVAIIVGPVPLSRFAAFECLESLKTSALDSLPLLTTAQIFAVRTPADAFSNARRTDRVAFIDMQTATAVEATDSGCAQLIPDGRITFVWCARVLPREAPLCGATHVLVFNKGTFQAVYQTGEVRKNGALLRAHFDRRQQSGTSVDNNDLISDNIADLALMD